MLNNPYLTFLCVYSSHSHWFSSKIKLFHEFYWKYYFCIFSMHKHTKWSINWEIIPISSKNSFMANCLFWGIISCFQFAGCCSWRFCEWLWQVYEHCFRSIADTKVVRSMDNQLNHEYQSTSNCMNKCATMIWQRFIIIEI